MPKTRPQKLPKSHDLYTCVAPLAIGGIIAGADDGQVETLRIMGKKIGLAYQIRNDLDNLRKFEVIKNKGRALDITQGKRTVIVAHSLSHSHEAELLASILSSGTENPMQVRRAVGIMEDSGSLAFPRTLLIDTAPRLASCWKRHLQLEREANYWRGYLP